MSRPRCAKLCSIDQTGVLTRFQTLNCSNRFEETFLFNWEKSGLSLVKERRKMLLWYSNEKNFSEKIITVESFLIRQFYAILNKNSNIYFFKILSIRIFINDLYILLKNM